jgi:6-pyruvoyltetrahydropterin/6-carboxytetrahydropterin synthase
MPGRPLPGRGRRPYNAAMFRLTREVRFAVNAAAPPAPSAAAGPAAAPAPADARPTNAFAGFPSLNGLGHYFTLAVTVAGDLDADSSYLLNIKDVDRAVRERGIPIVDDVVRHRPERFGPATLVDLFAVLKDAWPAARVESIRLALSPLLSIALLAQEYPMTRLSQKFEFSASHRLHNPALSDDVNRRTYGKCNNPHGHGHNYEVQVTLAGTPAADTSLLVDVPAFERAVAETVIDRLDHKNLNVEVPEFRDLIPSVENIARVIYRLLKPKLETGNTRLAAVTVWETPKTWCEYSEGNGE